MLLRNLFLLVFLIYVAKFSRVSLVSGHKIVQRSPTLQEYAKSYLNDANKRIYRAFEDLENYQFNHADPDSDEIFRLKVNAYKAIDEASRYLRQFPVDAFDNEELKREINVLSKSVGIYALNKNELQDLQESLWLLKQMAIDSDLCDYNDKKRCDKRYLPHVRQVYAESHNPYELQHYWTEWRDKNSIYAEEKFRKFVESFLNASRITGQHPLELWYKDYEDPNFLLNLERVMTQLKDFYVEIHAYIRDVLHKKYGEIVVSRTGPLPQHLVDQVMVQAWKKNSLIENPFPNKRLPNLKHELDVNHMDSENILHTADQFYMSLGLHPLSNKFWNNVKVKPKEERLGDCKSTVYDFIPDGALEYCPQENIKKFLQAHRDFGLLHYVNQERNLPFAFYDSYNFEYGVGEAAILSASSPKHMKRIGLLAEFNYDDERNLNRIFRLSLHTMFNLPIHFVQSKVLADIFDGKVNYSAPNKHYWNLMEEWAGIEPPVDRAEDNFDFSVKFYENLEENHQTRKFVAEILAYQFYQKLCHVSREYDPNDPKQPLNNCDFYESKEAGNILKSMMFLGSSKPWRDVLRVALGNSADLNAYALLEYFEPVYRWIKAENDKNGVYRGWGKSRKQIYSS